MAWLMKASGTPRRPLPGDWVNLRAHTPDEHNLRFRMLWDDTNLYILGETDWDDFVEGPTTAPDNPDWGGGGYNINFYLDPNTDGEEYYSETWAVDGYQWTWDVYEGHASRRPTPGNPEQSLRDPLDDAGDFVNDYIPGMFFEGHANAAFGNQGLYDLSNDGPNGNYRDDSHPGIVWSQNASNTDLNGTGQAGGVWEVAIAWSEMNATDPNKLITEAEREARPPEILDEREFITDEDGFEIDNPTFGEMIANSAYLGEAGEPDPRFADPASPLFIDNGLYAVDGPSSGDVWAFETSAITNDSTNFLPSWSEPLDGDPTRSSFAPWGTVGHGRIQFAGGEPACGIPEGLLGGDFDGDGSVAFSDFLVLSASFGQAADGYEQGDIDCNGTVEFADFLVLSTNFGQAASGAEAVPEPNGCVLMLIGLLGLARRKRN